MADKETNKKTDKKTVRKDHQSINDNQFYLIFKEIIMPILVLVVSIVAIFQSNQALKVSEQTAQDTKSNNELINNYTVNMNKPTFNFRYLYGDATDVITGLDIENEGTSLSTNTIKLYPYLEIELRNSCTEEDFIQQEDFLLPRHFFYETILVPIGSDIFDIEYLNNRTGTLATITQNDSYEELIEEIEACDETLQEGERIVSIRLKCYLIIDYRNLNGDEDHEIERWDTGYIKKSSDSNYYRIDEEVVGVSKIEETGERDYNYVTGVSTGGFMSDSRQSLIDAIVTNRHTDRSGYITLEVKRLDQIQYSKQVIAEPGDIVLFRIHVKNTTDKKLENWSIRTIVPTDIEYIAGKTVVCNSTNLEGLRVSDNIITNSGMNIGGYRENGDAYVYFYVRVGEEAKKEDNNMIYRMIAQCSAGSVTGTIEDTADVIVESK